jgi:urease beta subunit
MIPGEVLTAAGTITLNAGRPTIEVDVTNTGDRPIQVGSHFHFFEANRALAFDRAASYGYRLDEPAGTARRFEPGETHRVALVPLGGARRVFGLNGLVEGPLAERRAEALARAAARGFQGA